MKPAAVLVCADGWWARHEKLCERFGLPKDISFEKYEEAYLRILDEHFGGRLANAPDDLKGEGLFTAIKGPKIGMIARMTYYHHEGGKVILERAHATMPPGELGLVPDWWEQTVH